MHDYVHKNKWLYVINGLNNNNIFKNQTTSTCKPNNRKSSKHKQNTNNVRITYTFTSITKSNHIKK